MNLEAYFDRLWPICRSLAGPGYRESLAIVSEVIPFTIRTFTSGSHVYGWTVPPEWSVRDAYVTGPQGQTIASFQDSNLALWSHSIPFAGTLSRAALLTHLYSDPNLPDTRPYRTTYYDPSWGFCIPHQTVLPEGNYTVVVDTALQAGELLVGEQYLPGDTEQEIVFSTYLCHPSMANNELSGPLAMMALYEAVSQRASRHYSYRFLIMPETIGSLCYLSRYGDQLMEHMVAGLVLTCVGDAHAWTYKRSRRTATRGDRAMTALLGPTACLAFDPTRGSDERNYCSPGFDLPMGVLMRAVPGEFPEYHTSADNKSLISFDRIAAIVPLIDQWTHLIENTYAPARTCPYGAIKLGADLYPSGGTKEPQDNNVQALLWAANLSDGGHDLLRMAERSGQPVSQLRQAIRQLTERGHLT